MGWKQIKVWLVLLLSVFLVTACGDKEEDEQEGEEIEQELSVVPNAYFVGSEMIEAVPVEAGMYLQTLTTNEQGGFVYCYAGFAEVGTSIQTYAELLCNEENGFRIVDAETLRAAAAPDYTAESGTVVFARELMLSDDTDADDVSADTDTPEDDTADGDLADTDTPEDDSADGESADTDTPEDDSADGESTDTDAPEDDTADGESTDADAPEDDSADGESTDTNEPEDDSADGESTDTDAPEDDSADGEPTDADAPEDDSADGKSTDTDAPEDDSVDSEPTDTDTPVEETTIDNQEKRMVVRVEWTVGACVVSVGVEDLPELEEETATASKNYGLSQIGAMEYLKTLDPAMLALDGESMDEYNVYVKNGFAYVNDEACLRLEVYSVDNTAQTNACVGRYFMSGNGEHIYRLEEDGSVVELT